MEQEDAQDESKIGLVRRSFEYINREMILHLYKSLIRPIIEYGNII